MSPSEPTKRWALLNGADCPSMLKGSPGIPARQLAVEEEAPAAGRVLLLEVLQPFEHSLFDR